MDPEIPFCVRVVGLRNSLNWLFNLTQVVLAEDLLNAETERRRGGEILVSSPYYCFSLRLSVKMLLDLQNLDLLELSG
jgi:hypothetical protein